MSENVAPSVAGSIAVTSDAFLGGRLSIEQPARGYRAGIDAILLAACVASIIDEKLRVLDVGAGVGTVGLAVATRLGHAEVVLMEREPELANLARGNVDRNGYGGRIRVATVAVEAPAAVFDAEGVEADSFDYVVANPPYHVVDDGTAAPDRLRAVSHAMPGSNLDAWGRFMARMAKPGGVGAMIHKAGALDRVLAVLGGRFGGLRVLPIYPRSGEPAIRVLVLGTKGSRAPLTVLPGLILHGDGNEFRPEVAAIFRDGAGLVLQ